MKLTHITSAIAAGLFLLSSSTNAFAGNKTTENDDKAKDCKATEQTANYPEKLIHDFPYIYSDTAYASEEYNVVVRAVWMAQRGRKTKVTSPDQLPTTNNESCVRFASLESKSIVKNGFTECNFEE